MCRMFGQSQCNVWTQLPMQADYHRVHSHNSHNSHLLWPHIKLFNYILVDVTKSVMLMGFEQIVSLHTWYKYSDIMLHVILRSQHPLRVLYRIIVVLNTALCCYSSNCLLFRKEVQPAQTTNTLHTAATLDLSSITTDCQMLTGGSIYL
jgi:hypothetical protein